ncbi:MAG: UDP-N-acetylmuramate:L-alanyl-gamma-D-glutamyl-meso-diaminopimelate ligase [Myxococcales bacterium 68-20]|mgnify:CR=1 FL=1|nr:UDP-N-acetylmuramate:L-alanyl-gamma-D-glutamyl-meso-diaminopimelate ligase [Myxococcales bacterium]OJY16511.1 MAG: UDP-N-acetylmuramate:L-alanyl-gamma-D-glutamyl-meso-diaminopimelate ligase [Myxococcales bacterium 68-20]
MRVHLIGVAGTGMGQLAKLLRDAGHDVSGSDVSFDPPMGPALEAAGIRCLPGWSADNIGKDLELVVVGNAIRKDNVEAVRALELELPRTSMSGALRERFLAGKRPLVVAGTHGKTTTSAMCAWILETAGLEPGFFIGGLPKNFDAGARAASSKRKIVGTSAKAAPFVVEGDEYDAVYWEKKPKFFDYVAPPDSPPDDVVIITSVEHDHIDIYPSAEVYERQFAELSAKVPEGGLIACDARDPRARAIVSAHARSRTAFYALDSDDTGEVTPTWLGAMVPPDPETGIQPFDLYLGGSYGGRFALKVPGAHNVRNALGALAACAEGFGVDIEKARQALATFAGVRRRQDLLGTPGGIAVYDDFAHHPTAVDETLRALRSRHPNGRLWAVFEPRSATACRNIHQDEYQTAFRAADRVLFAPLGRTNIPEAERLDVAHIARAIGDSAMAAASVDAIIETITREARAGDVVALLSNGAFGGIHARLLRELGART